ncbi:MAG: hypothetical protein KFF73_17780 [Cyclobacteriaceae bacterium]|nr:hypothetical protein [Cyclobacteriaceae bacterium]
MSKKLQEQGTNGTNGLFNEALKNQDRSTLPYNDKELTLDHMNHQLEELSAIIRTYNILNFKDKASQLDCICALMDKVIPGNNRDVLLQTIRETGYEEIQKAFITLNQVCEDASDEKEDLFAILKRHRLNYPVPADDNLKLYRFGQFLNVTLIHYHMQKRKGFKLTDLQQKIKWESAITLKPLLDRLILVLKMELPLNDLKGKMDPVG